MNGFVCYETNTQKNRRQIKADTQAVAKEVCVAALPKKGRELEYIMNSLTLAKHKVDFFICVR
jgi:hypothetical protein